MRDPRSERAKAEPLTPEEIERIRRMTPSEKIQRVLECNAEEDAIALRAIRAQQPKASDEELRLHLAASRLGRELMIKAFGWDPEAHNG